MKIKSQTDNFTTYELTEEECNLLIQKAKEAMQYTYPQAHNGFATAIMSESGRIFTGASYISDTHNTTMHGEAVCLAVAAQSGETKIAAIVGPNCHNCKQLIWESSIRSKIDTVIIIEEEGIIKQIPISILMPYAWPDRKGNK